MKAKVNLKIVVEGSASTNDTIKCIFPDRDIAQVKSAFKHSKALYNSCLNLVCVNI